MPFGDPAGRVYKSPSMQYYAPVTVDMRMIDYRIKKELGLSDEEYTACKLAGLKYCRKCKEWKSLEEYHGDKSQAHDKKYTICKVCKSLYMIEHYRVYRSQEQFKNYKLNALKRGLVFELTPTDFEQLKSRACTYCGRNDSHLGYDRIDNNVGYSLDNVTPCCSLCNYMKCNFDTATWLGHIERILVHMKSKGEKV